ncbi:MAG TPA: glycoside hydrolase domain-containing protein [Acidobacteriaceae bacterium]
MRGWSVLPAVFAAFISCGCAQTQGAKPATIIPASATVTSPNAPPPASNQFVGFDSNTYPGDDTMAAMHKTFAFTGYWLTVPPGAMFNQWKGKHEILKQQGWGFLALANGRLEAQIAKAQKAGTKPENLGRKDAAIAIASAKAEGFPDHTILFLDQEEGGRLTGPQAAYLLAWTETVAASGFRPGVYASGTRVEDDPGVFINTVQDIRDRVGKGHLHTVAIFDAQDECPPAPGCTLTPKPLSATGLPDLVAWQYSQSPRRPDITKSCGATYSANGKCYAPGFPNVFLDMDVAASADPSQGR